jgi:phosphopantetheine adenylyltransferase
MANYLRFTVPELIQMRDDLQAAIMKQLTTGRVVKATNATTDLEYQMSNIADMKRELSEIEKVLGQLDPDNNPYKARVIATKPDWDHAGN